MTYEFALLIDVPDLSDASLTALFAAGCDDATRHEADSFVKALTSAIEAIESPVPQARWQTAGL